MHDAHTMRLLEAHAAGFRRRHPNSHVRFAEVLGKRVSHLVGTCAQAVTGERKLPVTERIVMLVYDGDDISETALEAFAAQVAEALGGR